MIPHHSAFIDSTGFFVAALKLRATTRATVTCYHRVIQQYKEAGVTVSSSTINDWHNQTCDLLHPLYNALRRQLMKSPYIHCNESSFSVYNEEQHKVQNVSIWALSDALWPDVLFQYELGKKNNEIARSLLKSYKGGAEKISFIVANLRLFPTTYK